MRGGYCNPPKGHHRGERSAAGSRADMRALGGVLDPRRTRGTDVTYPYHFRWNDVVHRRGLRSQQGKGELLLFELRR